jgi:DNA-binding transcriptional MerR regulator
MAHKIAKLLLEHADTFLERAEAIKTAMSLGMPLQEIEEYLDWVDLMRRQKTEPDGDTPKDQKSHGDTPDE